MVIAPTDQETRAPLLKDVAYDHIKRRILDGSYPAGTFISDRQISVELTMSKTPIRAAFERLAEQSFVTISPQRGVIVREMTPREIADHYDIRVALETFVVRGLAGRLSRAQIDEVGAILELQSTQVSGDVDLQGFTESDSAFHAALAEFFGNAEIVKVMAHQRDKVQRVIESIFSRDSTAPACSYAEHRSIFDAICRGDGDDAARLIEQHLRNGKEFLLLGGQYGRA